MRKLRNAVAALGTAAAMTGLLFATSTPASASGEWCNNQTCFSINTNGRYVGKIETSVWSSNISNRDIKTHIWSTNGQINLWTKVENVPAWTTYRDYKNINQNFPPGTRICVEGWHDGRSVGLPCVTITD
ncbi:hypothetical protein [Streptomyces acidiscabies]|uniref:Secreted protein n=1 Tax=Streptomyces acidiscabies TaxID=42234 RepID=A0A0L0JZ67_9ACTN|nr:hypothetical protein [Streptomyces acidiscabies]MBP5937587.1 hypothetical protein [Streptomyces sp. LBUM 1476]KND30804.1 hypothetical protein IQ63_27240 [Streptomyces acidiscabies]MBZ3914320.1 hypothetical protein [Streptomyces acidiscabies]MDX2960954.1 hypothetical protein [Streptomyces acidiscabies]MDX3017011.1 hypothetical protein [Streptomyces acidiscabies]